MLFCDLDNFKSINDTHGHSGGDEVLKEVADRVRGACRTDDLIARLGGDEFVVLLTGSRIWPPPNWSPRRSAWPSTSRWRWVAS